MDTPTASAGSLKCVIVTPERAVLDEPADFIALPMYDGELGVLPKRAPLIGRLGFGELRMVRGGHTTRFFIDGGFAQVRNDVVTVLTPRALRQEEIDPNEAHRALVEAQKVVNSIEAIDEQLREQERARAQLRVAQRGTSTGNEAGH